MTTTAIMYSRPGCHLCDLMLAELGPLAAQLDLRIDHIDITDNALLIARYGERIPVLEIDGIVVCEARLDADLVRAHCSRPHR